MVLYKHGVGFFERSGALGAGESARLDFNATEMNDVLKSLTVEEKGGGKISGLRYDSMDPLSHKLAEFPFQIGERQPLARHARSAQGRAARVEVRQRDGHRRDRQRRASCRAATSSREREQLTLMLDSGELRTVDLSAATGIRFTDPQAAAAVQRLPGGAGRPRARRTSAACTSIPPMPKSAMSRPAT